MTAGDSSADDRVAPLEVSRSAPFGHGRRLPRHQDRRPLPAARRPGRAGHPSLGRGREPGHVRFLESIPQRTAIRKRLTALWDYEKYSPPRQRGRPVLLLLQHGLAESERPRTRPNRSMDRPASPARSQHALGRRHRRARGDQRRARTAAPRLWHRRGRLRLERVEGPRRRDRQGPRPTSSSGSSSRRPNGRRTARASIYGRFPEPKPGEDLKGANYYQKLYYHRLGTPAGRRPAGLGGPRAQGMAGRPQGHRRRQVPDPDRSRREPTTSTASCIGRSTSPTRKPVHLVGDFEAEYDFIDNDGPVFWFKTNKDAPRGKVVAIDTRKPEPEHWVELIPEAAETLEHVTRGRRPLPRRLSEGRPYGRPGLRPRRAGTSATSSSPGWARPPGSTASGTDKETFYAFTSFTTPATIYRYDVAVGRRARSGASPSSSSTRATTRRRRSSTRARTAPGSRCSSATRKG